MNKLSVTKTYEIRSVDDGMIVGECTLAEGLAATYTCIEYSVVDVGHVIVVVVTLCLASLLIGLYLGRLSNE